MRRWLLMLAAACAVAAADPATAQRRELKIGLMTQQSPVWCWAASASMALKYLGFPDINPVKNYQCGVVAAAFPECEEDCSQCETPLDRMPTFVVLLKRYRDRTMQGHSTGLRAWFQPNYVAYPEFSRIKQSIDRSYPVIGGISIGRPPANPAEPEHSILITGYDSDHLRTGEPWVTILDPYPYAGGESPWVRAGYSPKPLTGKLVVPWSFVRDRMNLTSAVFLEDRSS